MGIKWINLTRWMVLVLTTCCRNCDALSRSIDSILGPISDIQDHFDANFEYRLDDESITEKDEELATRMQRNLKDKEDILEELKTIIESKLANVQPSSTRPFQTCCDVPIPEYSRVHRTDVNFDAWCLDGDVLKERGREFSYLDREVMMAFEEKFEEWKNVLKWLYYGSEEGVLFNYPGSRNCASYDARLRPWYVESVTPQPKDVVIVLDVSGSMSTDYQDTTFMRLAQEAAVTVLGTLNPNDRVNIVAFDDRATTPNATSGIEDHGCFSTELVSVTIPNVQLMKRFINGLRARGSGTCYSKALQKAFQLFRNTPQSEDRREKVLLMMTDGEPTQNNCPIQDNCNLIREENGRLNNSVVIFTYGLGSGLDAGEILRNISKQHCNDESLGEVKPGSYTPVDEPNNLRYEMATFYDYFKNSGSSGNSGAVMFLTPYLDAYGTGMQVPMCIHIQKDFQLAGVLCIDHSLADYFDGVTSYSQSVNSYAFVIDSHFTTLIHPLLSNPTQITNGLTAVPVTSLEVNLGSEASQIIREDEGQVEITSRVVQSKGEVYWEGVRFERQETTFRWFRISDTGYYLVTVNPRDLQSHTYLWTGPYATTCNYYSMEEEPNLCSWESRVVSLDQSKFFYTSEAFKDYSSYRVRDEEISRQCSYLTGSSIVGNQWFKDNIKDTFALLEIIDTLFSDEIIDEDVLFIELVTVAGIHRIYPGMKVPDDYNPLEEAWFDRCRSSNGRLTVGLPERHPFGFDSGGISFCKPLYYNSDRSEFYGAVNFVVKMNKAWNILTQNKRECKTHRCFLMNEAGLIILHNGWFDSDGSMNHDYRHVHLMQHEPHIARDLILQGLAVVKECTEADFDQDNENGPRIHRAWQIKINNRALARPSYDIEVIEDSNIMLVTSDRHIDSRACECLDNARIGSCRQSNDDCFCPCYESNLDEYEFCSGILTLTTDSPVPCTPEPWTFSFNEILSEERTRGIRPCRNTAQTNKKKTTKSQDSKAWIAGIVVPVTLIFVFLVTLAVCCVIRRKETFDDTYWNHNMQMTPSNDPQYAPKTTVLPTNRNMERIPSSSSSGFSQTTDNAPDVVFNDGLRYEPNTRIPCNPPQYAVAHDETSNTSIPESIAPKPARQQSPGLPTANMQSLNSNYLTAPSVQASNANVSMPN